MIGFINFLGIILIFVGVFVNSTNRDPECREKLDETITNAKEKNLHALIIGLSVTVVETLILINNWDSNNLKLSLGFAVSVLAGALFLSTFLLIERQTISSSVTEKLIEHENEEALKMAKEKVIANKNDVEAAAIAALMNHYDKVITVDADESIGYKGWANAFYVNLLEKKVLAAGKVIGFENIISCSYIDDGREESTQIGTANSQTKVNNSSVVGRAIVGGMVAGGAGAIIGGATAKTNTTTNINTTTTTRTIHDYTVILNVKDILSPVCKIHCGENEKAVNEIIGTVNAIIEENSGI